MLRFLSRVFIKRHSAEHEEIVRRYGAVLQHYNVGPFSSVDSSVLPYSKHEIKSAIITCATTAGVTEKQRNALSVSFIFLADFVENLPARLSVGHARLAEEINEEAQQLWVEWQEKVGGNA